MSAIAEFSDNNGDAVPYTYGQQTHLNSTWDHHNMYGCYCDEGWHGYDCSLSACSRVFADLCSSCGLLM